MQFDTFCQSKKSIKFSFRLITFYYLIQRLLKVQTIWFDPYCPFKKKKKKKKKKLHSNCVFYFSKLLSRNYSQVFYASFHKKLYSFFFLHLQHFRKIWIRDSMGWPILSFKNKKINFCQKQLWFKLHCIFGHIYLETLDQDIQYLPYCPFKHFI